MARARGRDGVEEEKADITLDPAMTPKCLMVKNDSDVKSGSVINNLMYRGKLAVNVFPSLIYQYPQVTLKCLCCCTSVNIPSIICLS